MLADSNILSDEQQTFNLSFISIGEGEDLTDNGNEFQMAGKVCHTPDAKTTSKVAGR